MSRNTIIALGLDWSLTHGAAVGLNDQFEPVLQWAFYKKDWICISYKTDDLITLEEKVEKQVDRLYQYSKEFNFSNPLFGIDYSIYVHFNSGKIQTIYEAFGIGLWLKQLDYGNMLHHFNTHSYHNFNALITPKQVREYAGLPAKTHKKEVQNWYLTNTELSSTMNGVSNEDSIDAAIIAYYLIKSNKSN